MANKSMVLKSIPEDVYKELLRIQGEEKLKNNKQFSLEFAVYKIIKSTIKEKK